MTAVLPKSALSLSAELSWIASMSPFCCQAYANSSCIASLFGAFTVALRQIYAKIGKTSEIGNLEWGRKGKNGDDIVHVRNGILHYKTDLFHHYIIIIWDGKRGLLSSFTYAKRFFIKLHFFYKLAHFDCKFVWLHFARFIIPLSRPNFLIILVQMSTILIRIDKTIIVGNSKESQTISVNFLFFISRYNLRYNSSKSLFILFWFSACSRLPFWYCFPHILCIWQPSFSSLYPQNMQ